MKFNNVNIVSDRDSAILKTIRKGIVFGIFSVEGVNYASDSQIENLANSGESVGLQSAALKILELFKELEKKGFIPDVEVVFTFSRLLVLYKSYQIDRNTFCNTLKNDELFFEFEKKGESFFDFEFCPSHSENSLSSISIRLFEDVSKNGEFEHLISRSGFVHGFYLTVREDLPLHSASIYLSANRLTGLSEVKLTYDIAAMDFLDFNPIGTLLPKDKYIEKFECGMLDSIQSYAETDFKAISGAYLSYAPYVAKPLPLIAASVSDLNTISRSIKAVAQLSYGVISGYADLIDSLNCGKVDFFRMLSGEVEYPEALVSKIAKSLMQDIFLCVFSYANDFSDELNSTESRAFSAKKDHHAFIQAKASAALKKLESITDSADLLDLLKAVTLNGRGLDFKKVFNF